MGLFVKLDYASPIQPAPISRGVYRFRNRAVLQRGALLPQRCYVCNQPTSSSPLKVEVLWRRPESGKPNKLPPERILLHAYACHKHTSRSIFGMAFSILVGTPGLLLLVLGFSGELPPPFAYPTLIKIAGASLMIGAVAAHTAPSARLEVMEVDEEAIELEGFGELFLASLPMWGQPPGADASLAQPGGV
jgi:hypothetical protein